MLNSQYVGEQHPCAASNAILTIIICSTYLYFLGDDDVVYSHRLLEDQRYRYRYTNQLLPDVP
jgi:hypothetical protein